MEERINALLADEAFVAKMEQAESVEAVAALFQAEGVEVTAEEIGEYLGKIEDELDENALDDVAGGAAALIIAGGMVIAKALYDLLVKKYGSRWRSYATGGSGSLGSGGSFGGR